MNKGFADLCLTTWLRRHKARVKDEGGRMRRRAFILHPSAFVLSKRETGFEPATSTLARSHSTAELLPRERLKFYRFVRACQVRPCLSSQPVSTVLRDFF